MSHLRLILHGKAAGRDPIRQAVKHWIRFHLGATAPLLGA